MSPIQRARAVSQAQSVLGVTPSASERDIHNAWKQLAFKLHPDRGGTDTGALAAVNAAYTLLKERAKLGAMKTDQQNSAPAPERAPGGVRPRSVRPSLPVKHSKIDPGTFAACRALVADEPKGHGHVAISIERVGRKITYLVESELTKGINRVAMPVTNLSDPRKSGPTSMKFRAGQSGPGTLDVPEAFREKMFPGLTSVRFRFGV